MDATDIICMHVFFRVMTHLHFVLFGLDELVMTHSDCLFTGGN